MLLNRSLVKKDCADFWKHSKEKLSLLNPILPHPSPLQKQGMFLTRGDALP